MTHPHPAPADAVGIPGPEAVRLTSLCEKTLKRAHDRGESVGRFRIGRAVRYHRATLLRWLDSQVTRQTNPTATH